jgi:hypothetical protein
MTRADGADEGERRGGTAPCQQITQISRRPATPSNNTNRRDPSNTPAGDSPHAWGSGTSRRGQTPSTEDRHLRWGTAPCQQIAQTPRAPQ